MGSFNSKTAQQETEPTWLARNFPTLFGYYKLAGLVLAVSAAAKKGGAKFHTTYLDRSRQSLDVFRELGTCVEVCGLENLRSFDSPCVIVANHMSSLETWALHGIIYPIKEISFVVKQTLLKYPVFSAIMRALDPVAVSRSDPRQDLQQVLLGGEKKIAEGKSIVVFPQTTRTLDFDPAHFNSIGIKLARRAGVPVVPLALKTDAWQPGKLLKDFGPIHPQRAIHFCFGSPLEIKGVGRAEHEKIVAFIGQKLAEWREHEDI